MKGLEKREQQRADLTCWLDYRRAEYLRLKDARSHVTNTEIREAFAGYQQAVEALSRFLHEPQAVPTPDVHSWENTSLEIE